MCLSSVTSLGDEQIHVGYKYFSDVVRRNDAGRLLAPQFVQSACRYVEFRIGRWYKDENTFQIRADDRTEYPAGYHVFPSVKDAKVSGYSGQLYQVEYRIVLATGYEGNAKVVIAKNIRVVKKVK